MEFRHPLAKPPKHHERAVPHELDRRGLFRSLHRELRRIRILARKTEHELTRPQQVLPPIALVLIRRIAGRQGRIAGYTTAHPRLRNAIGETKMFMPLDRVGPNDTKFLVQPVPAILGGWRETAGNRIRQLSR